MPGPARIYSWERVWHPVHPALANGVPYVVLLVELPDADGIRMIGNLVGDPRAEVRDRRRSSSPSSRTTATTPWYSGGCHDDASPTTDPNAWRTETPGHAGWPRTARPGDPNKYFVVSADTHANEPADLWAERIDAKYKSRIPRIETDANGVRWSVMEGFRPTKLRESRFEGEDLIRSKAGADPEDRLRDLARDGVDAEVIFPNKGLSMWATPDPVFANAMCRVYNEWAWETFAKYNHALSPVAVRRDRRPRRRDRRDRALRRARLPRLHAAVQAGLGPARRRLPQLQLRPSSTGSGPACRRPASRSRSTSRPAAIRAPRAARAAR